MDNRGHDSLSESCLFLFVLACYAYCVSIPRYKGLIRMIDYTNPRWSKPHVAKIIEMRIDEQGETITCESLDGVTYELNLSGTKLHGFVSEHELLLAQQGAENVFPMWAEFGMTSPFVPYIEPLYTSGAFDRLRRNTRLKRFESTDGYQLLKRAHLVPVSIYSGEDLYYGQLF